MVFLKSALNIHNNLSFLIRTGVGLLLEDMKKAPTFDPTNPPEYSDKNEYFNNANNICRVSLWELGLYDLWEKYYSFLLKEIRKYENDNTTNFNKGMVYANLGVAQVAQDKIDEGFSNILKAHIEDEPYHRTDPSKSVFSLKLYSQVENGFGGREGTKDFILKHSQLYQTEETKPIDIAFLTNLVASLDVDSHILLVSVVEKIRRNFEILADKDNRFTRLQILLNFQDLCLSIENALKVKNNISRELKSLLDNLFSPRRLGTRPRWKQIFDDNYTQFCHATSITELRTNLNGITDTITNSKARRLMIFCLIRNFSAHNLDVGDDIVFQNKELIVDNLISSILFLHGSTYI